MILLLAGTGEAREIAKICCQDGLPIVASLAGVTRAPLPLGVETRHGGFGGDAGFRDWLEHRQPSAVLDATHPFAHHVSSRSFRICRDLGIPYRQFARPAWTPGPEDRWTSVATPEAVASLIEPGCTVFLATGRQTLHRFASLDGCDVICRQIDPPKEPFPFANGRFLVGRPPFSLASERALFQALGVDWLVVKNAGGDASSPKLAAARQLGLRVAMINRPPPSGADFCETIPQALAWIRTHL